MKPEVVVPTPAVLSLQGWHGLSTQWVVCVGATPTRFRIRAVTRTRLAGRGRWLKPGEEALVPRGAVQLGADGAPPEVVAALAPRPPAGSP